MPGDAYNTFNVYYHHLTLTHHDSVKFIEYAPTSSLLWKYLMYKHLLTYLKKKQNSLASAI